MKGPEQAPGRVKGEQDHSGQEAQSEDQVRQPQQPSASQRPQQIVHEAQDRPQSRRFQKLTGLSGNGKLHQPKSRAKKPPASRPSSS